MPSRRSKGHPTIPTSPIRHNNDADCDSIPLTIPWTPESNIRGSSLFSSKSGNDSGTNNVIEFPLLTPVTVASPYSGYDNRNGAHSSCNNNVPTSRDWPNSFTGEIAVVQSLGNGDTFSFFDAQSPPPRMRHKSRAHHNDYHDNTNAINSSQTTSYNVNNHLIGEIDTASSSSSIHLARNAAKFKQNMLEIEKLRERTCLYQTINPWLDTDDDSMFTSHSLLESVADINLHVDDDILAINSNDSVFSDTLNDSKTNNIITSTVATAATTTAVASAKPKKSNKRSRKAESVADTAAAVPMTNSSKSIDEHDGMQKIVIGNTLKKSKTTKYISTNAYESISPQQTYQPAFSSTISPPNMPANVPAKVVCNCKKSRCLKLYCDCFKTSNYCDGCNCIDCVNTIAYTGTARSKAIEAILERNPSAFTPRVTATDPTVSSHKEHRNGCHCKKSNCLKKYCECFSGSAPCQSDKCRCTECKNGYITVPSSSSSPPSSAAVAAAINDNINTPIISDGKESAVDTINNEASAMIACV